jgi:hypothetical protein
VGTSSTAWSRSSSTARASLIPPRAFQAALAFLSALMSFVGGKLKLKGGEELKVASGGVKKKKKKAAPPSEDDGQQQQQLARVPSVDAPAKDGDALATVTASKGGTGSGSAAAGMSKEELQRALRGTALPQPSEAEDRRTEAEKRFQAQQVTGLLESLILARCLGYVAYDRWVPCMPCIILNGVEGCAKQ